MKVLAVLALFVAGSCVANYTRKDYFGDRAGACTPTATDVLGSYERDWSQVLQSAGEKPLFVPNETSPSLVVYRVSVYEIGNDEVPEDYRSLQSIVRIERDGISLPRLTSFRGSSQASNSRSLSEMEWAKIAQCWVSHPVTQVLGLGCRQASRRLEGMYRTNGLYDWVLMESLRDGKYEVVDFVAPDLVHNLIPERGESAARGLAGAADEGDNLTWLRHDGPPPEPLSPESGVVWCAQMMLGLPRH